MFKKLLKPLIPCTRHHHVTVVGGASDIGQTVSLLLRGQTNISELIIHDTQAQTPGVIMDVSHVPTNTNVRGYVGEDSLHTAIKDAEIIICAGSSIHKPDESDTLSFNYNMNFIQSVAKAVSRLSPMPFVGIVTNPINVLVPMAAEIIKQRGDYDRRKLFGITGVDVLRAQTLFAADHDLEPSQVNIPVIGGHSPTTCLPLLSQMQPLTDLDDDKAEDFTERVRSVEENIIAAKGGSPVLSVAYSAVLFTRLLLDAIDSRRVSVNGLVEINDFGTEFFSGLIEIDRDGVREMQRYHNLSPYEISLLETAIHDLREDVMHGKKLLD